MSDDEPLSIAIRCHICEGFCADFELLPPGASRILGPDNPRLDSKTYRIYVSTFERGGDDEISERDYRQLHQLFSARDYADLYDENWRYVTYWCRECNLCYCINHWRIEYSDDDPMCSEWGTCPRGHGKILSD